MMTTMSLFLCLVILLGSGGVSSAASSQQCHAEDEAALLALNDGLGSPYRFSSWTTDTWCCDWHDVDCDNSTGRVIGLSVSQDGNLTAAGIPDAIADLTHLQKLTVRHVPGLTGVIPESLAQLSNLSELIISYTGVSGPVPSFLGQLASLTLLDLSSNALSGSVPASLGDLPGLAVINLSHNRLTGAIPPQLFSNLSSLPSTDGDGDGAYLWLSRNNLSGVVPAEFAAVSFAHLDLSRNALTGDPSSALLGAARTAMRHLDLSRNGFRFSLTGAELPGQLSFLDLSHNAIRGRIPVAVANLTNLQELDLSFNKLCGQVPSGLARFNATSFQHNKCLCGAPLQACPKIS